MPCICCRHWLSLGWWRLIFLRQRNALSMLIDGGRGEGVTEETFLFGPCFRLSTCQTVVRHVFWLTTFFNFYYCYIVFRLSVLQTNVVLVYKFSLQLHCCVSKCCLKIWTWVICCLQCNKWWYLYGALSLAKYKPQSTMHWCSVTSNFICNATQSLLVSFVQVVFAFGGLTNSFWLMCFARFIFGWVLFTIFVVCLSNWMCTVLHSSHS